MRRFATNRRIDRGACVGRVDPENRGRRRDRRQARRESAVGEDDDRRGIGEHVGKSRPWIVRIEREVGGTGFEDGRHRDHHVQGAPEGDPDDLFRFRAEPGEALRQAVRSRVDLGVGKRRRAEHQRGRVGRALRLSFEHFRESRRGGRPVLSHEILDEEPSFLRAEHVDAAQGSVGVFYDAFQQRDIVTLHLLHAASVEEILVVHPIELHLVARFDGVHFQIETDPEPFAVQRCDVQTFEAQRFARRIL